MIRHTRIAVETLRIAQTFDVTPELPTAANIRPGQTLYYVMSLGKQSCLREFHVDGYPYNHEHGYGLFVKGHTRYSWGNAPDSMSLRDANVEPNIYNRHRVFFDKAQALAYVEWCKVQPPVSNCEHNYGHLCFKPETTFDWSLRGKPFTYTVKRTVTLTVTKISIVDEAYENLSGCSCCPDYRLVSRTVLSGLDIQVDVR